MTVFCGRKPGHIHIFPNPSKFLLYMALFAALAGAG
jgi:hypothetical protein